MRVNQFSVVMGAALFYTCLSSINGQNQNDAKGKCRCVSYYFCINGTIVSNPTTNSPDGNGSGIDMSVADLMDVRLGEDESSVAYGEGGCNHYLEKCCMVPESLPTGQPTIKPQNVRKYLCGNRQVNGANRIVSDTDSEAQYGEFPWMVAIFNTSDGQESFACGGSIIHNKVILTAAHCVNPNNTFIVRAGEWNTQTNEEKFPIQERNVKEIIIHELLYRAGFFNDIALLLLDSPLESSDVVSSICLPDQGENMDNRRCILAGWGKKSIGRNVPHQAIMKKTEVPVVPRDQCLQVLRKSELGVHFKLHESLICAGGEAGKDACQGDGGGPLACPSKDNPQIYVQAGIVAAGLGCGRPYPAIYANVPLLMEWIKEKLDSLGFS